MPTCKPVGIGTQRLEETLQTRFPEARILRVDRDSTRNKGAWSAMRKQIHDGEADILIGTQMLAKGHDFPNLTLVGVHQPGRRALQRRLPRLGKTLRPAHASRRPRRARRQGRAK